MSIEAAYVANLTVVETLETNVPAVSASDAGITHNGWNKSATLNASSTPPATKTAAFQKALSTGSGTIDLTALPGTNGATVDGTGLKVQAIKFANPAANANPITVAVGASNGYDLFGSAFSITLQPGQEALFYGNDATPDVGASDKTLDLTGTGSQALNVQVVLG